MSKGLNKAQVIGNLGQEPELKYTGGGVPVMTLSIVTNEKFKNKAGEVKEHVEWHRVILWNKLAEIAGKYLKKGSLVHIEGKLQTRDYEDKDGVKRYVTEIVAREMLMLGGTKGDGTAPPDATTLTDDDIPF